MRVRFGLSRTWLGALFLAAAAAYWLFNPAPDLAEFDLTGIDQAPFQSRAQLHAAPLQFDFEWTGPALSAGDFDVRPVAHFQTEARVLGRRDYRRGTEAELSPTDLALGWGPMADPAVLDSIRIRQSGRFYYWSTDEFPIPRRTLEQSSANMHMIPATPEIARELSRVRPDEVIFLEGLLVDIDRDDGWRWRSSRTRSDTGAGACEIVLITRLERSL